MAPGRHWLAAGRLVCGLLLGCVAAIGFGHEQKTAVTRILFNANTGNIEVMHRFLVHDAEHAAGLIFGERQPLLESAQSRELFASYVINRFAIEASLEDGSSLELELDYVGEEVDGQFVWVYQETSELPNITALTVFNAALRDVWPDQDNLVNIEKGEQIYSLSFVDTGDVLTIEF
jgi:hypothetical protein